MPLPLPSYLCASGHSLGGALSQLAAFEIAKRWPTSRLVVYTFGSPRVGNLAWVHEYDAAVPQTWCIINAQVCVQGVHQCFLQCFLPARQGCPY